MADSYITLNDQETAGNVSVVQIATGDYVSGSLILLQTIETLGEDGVVFHGGFEGENLVGEKDGRLELQLKDEVVANLAQTEDDAVHCIANGQRFGRHDSHARKVKIKDKINRRFCKTDDEDKIKFGAECEVRQPANRARCKQKFATGSQSAVQRRRSCVLMVEN